jgi:hypothetical protein
LVGQGKKIGGNLCGWDDSCDQHYRATQHIRRKPMATSLIVNTDKRNYEKASSLPV